MYVRLQKVASLLFLIWIIPTLAFAGGKATLIGKIVDQGGKPVQGVAVTATSPQIPSFKVMEITDKKGVFTVDFDQIDVTYVFRFDKTGYDSLEAQLNWSREGTQFFDWKMTPSKVEVAPGTAPASTSAPAVDAFNAGLAAFKAKDYATAEVKFKEAVQNDPNLRQAWAALGAVELELGHNQDAAVASEKAIALGSTEEAVFLARWQAYRNLKDGAKTAEALKDLERIGRRAEEAKKIHNEAVALVKAGNNEGAYAKFKEALEVDPNLQVSLFGLANAALKTGRNAEAAAAAETILKAEPGNEQAVRIRYNACLGLGDKAKLIDALLGLAPFEPKVARDGIVRLAFEAYDANDLTVAEDRFGKALQVDPSYPTSHYYMGVIDAGRGEMEKARTHIERFLQLAPKDPEADSAREMLKYLKK